ncbi:hypothetical protein AHF37_04224 [Paragonimus kellicotti]|nr:hypothetical protein AHF37_04224 [Paragonimus kellicotti]
MGTLNGTNIGNGNICIWHINTTSGNRINLMIPDVTGAASDHWYQVFIGSSCATSPVTKRNGPTIAAYNYQANTSELVVVSYGIPIQATYMARASLESMAWVKYSMILTAAAAWWKI